MTFLKFCVILYIVMIRVSSKNLNHTRITTNTKEETIMIWFFKKSAYQWNQAREERRYKRMLRQIVVVVDTSILLDREEFEMLLWFRMVIIPHAVFDHLRIIGRYGAKNKEDDKKDLAAEALEVILHRIDPSVKEYKWDIGGSYGTGLKSELGQIKLEELNQDTQKEIQRKKHMDTEYTLGDRDILGSPYDRKLRVLATAKAIQQGHNGIDRKVILATRDINMLAIAEDEKLGLIAVPSLTKLYLLDIC